MLSVDVLNAFAVLYSTMLSRSFFNSPLNFELFLSSVPMALAFAYSTRLSGVLCTLIHLYTFGCMCVCVLLCVACGL